MASPEYQGVYAKAVTAFEEDYRESWAFTEERTRNGTTWVGRWDPRNQQPWELLKVDGAAPKPEDLGEYLDQKEQEAKRAKERPQRPEAMVADGSITLREETADYWHFEFQPAGEGDNADFMDYMDGDMIVLKTAPEVAMINIQSSGEFKPRFGFKVNEFLSRFEFTRAEPGGPVVPQRLDFHISARAMGLMNVEEKVTVHYRDYERVVGDASERLATD